jgi:hypothetical protein
MRLLFGKLGLGRKRRGQGNTQEWKQMPSVRKLTKQLDITQKMKAYQIIGHRAVLDG